MQTDPSNTGIKTSEFYTTVVSQVVFMATVFGIVPTEHVDDWIKVGTLVASSLVAMSTAIAYIYQRGLIKKAMIEKEKPLINSQATHLTVMER